MSHFDPFFTRILRLSVLCLSLSLAGFVLQAEESTLEPEIMPDGRLASPESYRLQAGDLIHIIVHQESDLERQLRVSQNGTVQLPLLGTVTVMNLTVEEASHLIRDLYDANYLVNPQVNLNVLEYSQRRVNVIGEVNRPGTVTFPPEESMTIIDAISLAGGPNSLATLNRVRLVRKLPNGDTETFSINVEEIISGNSDVLWVLKKDDTIIVPRRRI